MTLDEPTENDITIMSAGISFIYNNIDEPFMNDSIIDFEDSYLGRGFTVRNSTSTCC
jgi:Fe-S cluster assembly iron-binding protein IscA